MPISNTTIHKANKFHFGPGFQLHLHFKKFRTTPKRQGEVVE